MRICSEISKDLLEKKIGYPIFFEEKQIQELRLGNPVTPEILHLFFESPIICTDEFEKMWIEKNGTGSLNSLFSMRCSDPKEFFHLIRDSDALIQGFQKSLIFVDQRSEEWIDLWRNRFLCGNQGPVGSTFRKQYNLIRGSIIEMIASRLFEEKGYVKLSVGFVVESDTKGANGFAPDLLLFSKESMELIIVEIKGLKTSSRNGDYYRGLHLASKQLQSGKDILRKNLSADLLRIRGIILMCYIEEGRFFMEVHRQTLD